MSKENETPGMSGEGRLWQLCPKCNGDGNLLRYNSPPMMSTNIAPVCDVCNGAKILATPAATDAKSGCKELAEALESVLNHAKAADDTDTWALKYDIIDIAKTALNNYKQQNP